MEGVGRHRTARWCLPRWNWISSSLTKLGEHHVRLDVFKLLPVSPPTRYKTRTHLHGREEEERFSLWLNLCYNVFSARWESRQRPGRKPAAQTLVSHIETGGDVYTGQSTAREAWGGVDQECDVWWSALPFLTSVWPESLFPPVHGWEAASAPGRTSVSDF